MAKVASAGYDVALGPCRFFLRLFGIWPEPFVETKLLARLRTIIVISTMVFFATITQTVKNIKVWGDLNVVTDIFINSEVPTSTAVVKVLGLWYHRRALQKIVLQTSEDWKSSHTIPELREMESNARFSRLVSVTSIFLGNATFVTQGIIAFLKITSHSIAMKSINETDEWPLYMRAWLPYNTQASPNYELTLLGQLLSNFFAANTYISIDSLFIVLVLHLCGQLSVLRLTLINLMTKSENHKAFTRNIMFIHRRHNQLARFANTIEDIFNTAFLIQLMTSSLVLCMLGYQFVTLTSSNNMSFMELMFIVYYILCFLFITFTYCYMAEELRTKSTDICNAAYECNWIDLTHQQSKLLIIVMIRARHPFKLTAGKFLSFSLVLYCSILRSSGGYMSLLLAIQKGIAD